MDNRGAREEIITRMSTFSNAFKVLSATALIGMEAMNRIAVVGTILLMAIMDIYYFYMEKWYRNEHEVSPDDKIKSVSFKDKKIWWKVFKSPSIWMYYIMLLIIICIIILKR